MSELLVQLLAVNVLVGIAVLLVLALRLPARRLFGARVAYGLWLLAPLPLAAMLLPARVMVVSASAGAPPAALPLGAAPLAAPAGASGPDLPAVAVAAWIAGMLASAAWLIWRQARFGQAARRGAAGPAVIGVLRPRIVVPHDFSRRYTPAEQQVVLAHEQSHIARHDSRINALVALARCVNWFNPLIHLLAHALRIDQELACDARVVAAHPKARRAYAEAMLKTQLAVRPLPMGCHWLASAHPLAARIGLLARPAPGPVQRRLGVALLAILAMVTLGSAWASKPARVVLAEPSGGAPAVERRTPRPRPASEPAVAAEPVARAKPAPAIASVAELADVTPPALAAPDAEPPAADDEPAEPRRVYGMAERSWVEPGYAVRLVATVVAPDGLPVTADLTAYGSHRRYRTGWVSRNGSRYAIYTSVRQIDEGLVVTATLRGGDGRWPTGAAVMAPGETGEIVLDGGQVVTVTPTLRVETPEEREVGERLERGWSFASLVRRTAEHRAAYQAGRRALENVRRRCAEDRTCPIGL